MYLHPYMCALIQFLIFVLVISSYLSNIKILTYQLGQEKKIAVWLLIYLTSLLAERERRRWRQLSILIVWNLYNCRRRISNEKKLSAVWGHSWHHNYKLSGFVPKLKPSSSYRSKSNLVWRLKSLFFCGCILFCWIYWRCKRWLWGIPFNSGRDHLLHASFL